MIGFNIFCGSGVTSAIGVFTTNSANDADI